MDCLCFGLSVGPMSRQMIKGSVEFEKYLLGKSVFCLDSAIEYLYVVMIKRKEFGERARFFGWGRKRGWQKKFRSEQQLSYGAVKLLVDVLVR